MPNPNYEAPVKDDEGRFHRIMRDKKEMLRETHFVDELGERVETVYGATDTEVAFWNEIVKLRKRLGGEPEQPQEELAEDAL